ncbi:MAG: hypothetical protein HRT89_06405 [Lentisphaeria bacterium]|nr:hypothetical protein [Lentisphaeria bacterium]
MDIKCKATFAIWKITGNTKETVKWFTDNYKVIHSNIHNSKSLKFHIIATLSRMGPHGKGCQDILYQILKERDGFLSNLAASMLPKVSTDTKKSAIFLHDIVLNHRDQLTRISAAYSLWQIKKDNLAVHYIIKELKTKSQFSHYASQDLARIGAAAKPALEHLQAVDGGTYLEEYAKRAIFKIEEDLKKNKK